MMLLSDVKRILQLLILERMVQYFDAFQCISGKRIFNQPRDLRRNYYARGIPRVPVRLSKLVHSPLVQ